MKNVIKKSALIGFIGVPVFMISTTISLGIINGIGKAIEKHKNNK